MSNVVDIVPNITVADIQRAKALAKAFDISKDIDYIYVASPAEIGNLDFMCLLKSNRVHVIKQQMIPITTRDIWVGDGTTAKIRTLPNGIFPRARR